MVQTVLTVVFTVLILNLLAAGVVAVRQSFSWLLVILLTATTGAAAAAVLAVLAGGDVRFLDTALVLTATAAVTAAVRGALLRRHRSAEASEAPAAGSSAGDPP